MAWRKWLVRGIVFSVLGGAALATLLYQRWTSPDAVRAQVLAKMRTIFPGAAVMLDSARLRILGGIQVHELRLARPAGRDKNEFAHIPSAVLHHNKEKLLEGELLLRKVELHRPRFWVVRDAEGVWNMQGVVAPSDPSKALPTLVVHQASVVIDDRYKGLEPLTLSDVHLTLINDPLPTVVIDGVAHSDLFGKVMVHAVWDRAGGDLSFSLRSDDFALNQQLLERFGPALCPAGRLQGVELDGRAGFALHAAYHPDSAAAWSCGARLRMSQTRIAHPELPLPLEELSADLFLADGELRLERLHARAGAALVSAKGVGLTPCLEEDFEAAVTVEGLQLDDKLAERLPAKLKALAKSFHPQGSATVKLLAARRSGHWTKLADGSEPTVTLQPNSMTMQFEDFPCPLSKVDGALTYNLSTQRLQVDISAAVNGRPVTIRGHWQGEDARVDAQFDIHATDVPLSPTLIEALHEPARSYVQSFHATALIDFNGQLRRKTGQPAFEYQYTIGVHDASVRWDQFRFPLVEVAGVIVVTPQRWEFKDFRGRHREGTVTLSGKSIPGVGDEKGISVFIVGTNLPVDAALRQALAPMPHLEKAWNLFQPTGRLHFTAAIERRGARPEDLEIRLDVKGPTIEPAFFEYSLHDFSGYFHFHDLRLDMRRLSATHDEARFYLERGAVDVHPQGALFVDLPEVHAQNLRLDQDLIAALPQTLRQVAESLNCRDRLRLKTRFVLSQGAEADALPDVFWDGQLWLSDAALTVGLPLKHVTGVVACTGRHNGRRLTGLVGNIALERAALYNQPFRNVHSDFHVLEQQPELLKLNLKAPLFGGDITGQASLDFSAVPRYELNLTASQIDLQELGRHNNIGANSENKSEITGIAAARLVLAGVGSDANTLDGHGSIDVPSGKLLNLPFLLDLIKFLGLRWPDRTMFEEAHAQFAIRGRRVRVQRVELYGNAVSFTGKGEVGLDGSDLSLELYPSWARIEQLLPPAVRAVPPALSKNFLTVEAKGKITGNPDDIKFMKKPVPILIDPLMNIRDRMLGPSQAEPRRTPEALDFLRTPELSRP